MATPTRFTNDVEMTQSLTVKGSVAVPVGGLSGKAIDPNNPVPSNATTHQFAPTFAQGSAVTVAAATQLIHTVRGLDGGVIKEVAAGLIATSSGNSTVSFDVKKNGVSILSAPISHNSGVASGSVVLGSISVSNVAMGDRIEVAITPSVGTGTLGTGAFVRVTVDEGPVN